MVAGHILDSLSVRPYLHGECILDIGTGPGFPGLPLAIVEPDRQFVLVDSNGKKISFVNHAIGELGLDNVTAVKARAEDYAPGASFDTVTDSKGGLLEPGKRIKGRHKYVIEESIAKSGFGATFRALRIKDEKQVLIKQMLEQSSYDQFRSELLKSFKRECKF